MNEEDAHTLAALLENAVSSISKTKSTGIAFSGGVDSGILAFIARRHARVHAYTVAVNRRAKDALTSQESASLLGIEHTLIIPSEKEIMDAIECIKVISGVRGRFLLSILVPIWFVLLRAEEKVILDGLGADELFGGYAKYMTIRREDLNNCLAEDLKKALDLARREDLLAGHLKKLLYHPFLSEEIIRYAFSLPPARKVSNGSRKVILRDAGKVIGVPESIIHREKKALQYGSGMEKVLKELGVENDKSDTEI